MTFFREEITKEKIEDKKKLNKKYYRNKIMQRNSTKIAMRYLLSFSPRSFDISF